MAEQIPTNAQLPIEPHVSWLGLDDESIGMHFWAWFIHLVLGRWGIDLREECLQKPLDQVLADHGALLDKIPSVALELDQDDPEGTLLEKAAKFCMRSELARAGVLIRGFIEERDERARDKAKNEAERARQRERAKKSRPNPLSNLIDSIVSRSPDISALDLLGRLISEIGNGVIESVGDYEYVWLAENNTQKTHKISGLKDVLRRSRIRTTNRGRI